MNRLSVLVVVLVFALGACAVNMGAPSPIELPTVALRADAGATPAQVAEALNGAEARAAFVAAPEDTAWFRDVAGAAGRTLVGPAPMGALRIAFVAPEALGDTTLTLAYDGGRLPILDALYEIEDDRLLDLLAFQVEDDGHARAAVGALLEYVATDVGNSAALVLAAVVPSAAAGDSVARLLSPAYYDAGRCGTDAAASTDGVQLRVFYGPEARMYCEGARSESGAAGEWLRAQLVMGRR
jgi:hypothetical protein